MGNGPITLLMSDVDVASEYSTQILEAVRISALEEKVNYTDQENAAADKMRESHRNLLDMYKELAVCLEHDAKAIALVAEDFDAFDEASKGWFGG